MWCTSKKRLRKPLILLEVLIALTILSLFLPTLNENSRSYALEIKELEIKNKLENAFRERILYLMHDLYAQPLYKQLPTLTDSSFWVDMEPIVIEHTRYPVQVSLQRLERNKDSSHWQIRAYLHVRDSKKKKIIKSSNAQNFYIKKN